MPQECPQIACRIVDIRPKALRNPAARRVAVIKRLCDIERVGADVTVVTAHLDSLDAVRALVDTAVSNFGNLDGIFHLAGLVRSALFTGYNG